MRKTNSTISFRDAIVNDMQSNSIEEKQYARQNQPSFNASQRPPIPIDHKGENLSARGMNDLQNRPSFTNPVSVRDPGYKQQYQYNNNIEEKSKENLYGNKLQNNQRTEYKRPENNERDYGLQDRTNTLKDQMYEMTEKKSQLFERKQSLQDNKTYSYKQSDFHNQSYKDPVLYGQKELQPNEQNISERARERLEADLREHSRKLQSDLRRQMENLDKIYENTDKRKNDSPNQPIDKKSYSKDNISGQKQMNDRQKPEDIAPKEKYDISKEKYDLPKRRTTENSFNYAREPSGMVDHDISKNKSSYPQTDYQFLQRELQEKERKYQEQYNRDQDRSKHRDLTYEREEKGIILRQGQSEESRDKQLNNPSAYLRDQQSSYRDTRDTTLLKDNYQKSNILSDYPSSQTSTRKNSIDSMEQKYKYQQTGTIPSHARHQSQTIQEGDNSSAQTFNYQLTSSNLLIPNSSATQGQSSFSYQQQYKQAPISQIAPIAQNNPTQYSPKSQTKPPRGREAISPLNLNPKPQLQKTPRDLSNNAINHQILSERQDIFNDDQKYMRPLSRPQSEQLEFRDEKQNQGIEFKLEKSVLKQKVIQCGQESNGNSNKCISNLLLGIGVSDNVLIQQIYQLLSFSCDSQHINSTIIYQVMNVLLDQHLFAIPSAYNIVNGICVKEYLDVTGLDRKQFEFKRQQQLSVWSVPRIIDTFRLHLSNIIKHPSNDQLFTLISANQAAFTDNRGAVSDRSSNLTPSSGRFQINNNNCSPITDKGDATNTPNKCNQTKILNENNNNVEPKNGVHERLYREASSKNIKQTEYCKNYDKNIKEKQEAEMKQECTFKPKINKHSEQIIKRSKSFQKSPSLSPIRQAIKGVEDTNNLKINTNSALKNNKPLKESPIKSYRSSSQQKKNEKPILFVDISISKGKSGKLSLYKGEDPEKVAETFARTYDLSIQAKQRLIIKLKSLLSNCNENTSTKQ